MKKLILFSFFNLLMISLSFAQKQEWAAGVRFGEPTGIEIKKYLKGGSNAIDVVLGVNGYGYGNGRKYWKDEYEYRRSATLMVNYLWHKPIKGAKGLDIYYGVGGQLSSRRYYDRDEDEERSAFGLGVTGTLGIEWYIPSTPISISADLVPYLELVPATAWLWINGGVGIKVNF